MSQISQEARETVEQSEETLERSEEAITQAMQVPVQQAIELQRNWTDLFLTGLEMSESAQQMGTNLTRSLFRNYMGAVESSVDEAANQMQSAGPSTDQQPRPGQSPGGQQPSPEASFQQSQPQQTQPQQSQPQQSQPQQFQPQESQPTQQGYGPSPQEQAGQGMVPPGQITQQPGMTSQGPEQGIQTGGTQQQPPQGLGGGQTSGQQPPETTQGGPPQQEESGEQIRMTTPGQ